MTRAEQEWQCPKGGELLSETKKRAVSQWRRRATSALTAAVVFASLAACVTTSSKDQPSTLPSIQAKVVPMNTRAETMAGNSVIVYSFVSPVGKAPAANMINVAADIEACAGAIASSQTGVASTLFSIETPDKTVWPSVGAVKKPALQPTYLARGRCERGWVTFRVPQGEKPVYVVLLSSAIVKWKIP
jgi:hypothetical protein